MTKSYMNTSVSRKEQEEIMRFNWEEALQTAFLNAADRVEAAIMHNEPDIVRVIMNALEPYQHFRNILLAYSRYGLPVLDPKPLFGKKVYSYNEADLWNQLSPEARRRVDDGEVQL